MSESVSFMLDRRVTLAVIAALVFQTASALLWAGAATERLKYLETRVAAQPSLAERTAALEARVRDVQRSTVRIEQKVDLLLHGQNLSDQP
ncbi:MAG: hypothetical protein AAGC95_14450 [Pseudomonadota bacterium]